MAIARKKDPHYTASSQEAGFKSLNCEILNTALTGTTGIDGNVSISLIDETLYIENRTGASRYINLKVADYAY